MLNNYCGRLFSFSFIILLTVILIDYNFCYLPITGLWLIIYILFITTLSIWVTCVNIQKLLQRTIPFDYDLKSNKTYNNFQKIYKLVSKPIERYFSHNITTNETKNVHDSRILNIQCTSNAKTGTDNNCIDARIECFVNDIEYKFITKWYTNISNEKTFVAESNILLEGVLRRLLQVSVQVDNTKIACGVLVILLKHLKEYRRAVRRATKNDGGDRVENVYRYSHIGNKSEQALQHFSHRLTANVLREFVSWELWTSLPCRLLVSILSKRLTTYFISYFSKPGWLNYKILYQFLSQTEITNLKLDNFLYISLSNVNLSERAGKCTLPSSHEKVTVMKKKMKRKSVSSTPKMSPKKEIKLLEKPVVSDEVDVAPSQEVPKTETCVQPIGDSGIVEQALTKMITQHTAPILQKAEKINVSDTLKNDNPAATSTKPVEDPLKIKTYSPKRSDPVKIHSAKSTNKRWDDSDLSNVSIGQDMLALDGLDSAGLQGFSGRRLWGFSAEAEKEMRCAAPVPEMADKDVTEEVRVSPKVKPRRPETRERVRHTSPPTHSLRHNTTAATDFVNNTIKPMAGNVTASTLHNMRELQQTTVNNVVKPVSNATEKAIHKIGDLQDEAVGVVEGIFDFGMAGIRKGLRLTGLQDSHGDLHHKVSKPPVSAVAHQMDTSKQIVRPGPRLAKLGHVTSEDTKSLKSIASEPLDSSSVWINPIAKDSPNGYENQMLLEKSPIVPESDVAVADTGERTVPDVPSEPGVTTVDSPEYEETADLASAISKLRSLLQQKSSESNVNTPAVSPMLIDDKSCPTPTDTIMADVTRGDGGMQRFARTVTGMFNTFKTALPGNASDNTQNKQDHWLFIENETYETDLPSLLNSLLMERRDYCTVDTAYEAMDSVDLLTDSISSQVSKIQWDNPIYEDELDDLDSMVPITKVLLDVICECMQDSNCVLNKEPVMKAALVLLGVKVENVVGQYSEKLVRYIHRIIGPLPKNYNDNVLAMDINEYVTKIVTSLPCYIRDLFGVEDIRTGLNFFISSLQSAAINQDIVLQLFEFICSQLIYVSSQMSPTPSA